MLALAPADFLVHCRALNAEAATRQRKPLQRRASSAHTQRQPPPPHSLTAHLRHHSDLLFVRIVISTHVSQQLLLPALPRLAVLEFLSGQRPQNTPVTEQNDAALQMRRARESTAITHSTQASTAPRRSQRSRTSGLDCSQLFSARMRMANAGSGSPGHRYVPPAGRHSRWMTPSPGPVYHHGEQEGSSVVSQELHSFFNTSQGLPTSALAKREEEVGWRERGGGGG